MPRNQTSASFFINQDSIRRKTLESEPLISKSEMEEIPKFITKKKKMELKIKDIILISEMLILMIMIVIVIVIIIIILDLENH